MPGGTRRDTGPGFKGSRKGGGRDEVPSRFMGFTVKRLRRIAEAMGVELPSGRVRKKEIVEAIEAHQPGEG